MRNRDTMRSTEPAFSDRRRNLWLMGLGACTLWLVVQNTLLLLAFLWVEPEALRVVGIALAKAGWSLAPKLWAFPFVSVVVGGILAAAWRGRDANAAPGEVGRG